MAIKQAVMRYALLVCALLFSSSSFAQDENLPFLVPKNYLELPPSAMIKTTKGDFEVELYRRSAPITVRNFEYLARQGLYIDSYFTNYREDRYIQAGSLKNTAKKPPRYLLPPEIGGLRHEEGTLATAAPPRNVNPQRLMDGMQFYITHKRVATLDGQYTIFGKVIWGLERAKTLRPGDKILAVKFPKSYTEVNPRSSGSE